MRPTAENEGNVPNDVADVATAPPLFQRFLHRRTQLALDFVVLLAAFWLSYLLRFDFALPRSYFHGALVQAPLVVLVQFVALFTAGVYAFVWRYVGIRELGAFVTAALYWSAPLLLLRLLLPPSAAFWRMPLSVLLMDTVLAGGALLGLRVGRRILYERYERDTRRRSRGDGRLKRTVLIGAGRAGVLAVREIQNRGDADIEVVGFVDDDPLKQNTTINGVRVLGFTRDLPRLTEEHGFDQAVITIVDAGPEIKRSIAEICERTGLPVRTIPGYYEILQGQVSISRFRDVAMEDLLQRDPVRLETQVLEQSLGGKRVLVSGAGGSIGSELALQIARFEPAQLILLERAEFALFDIDRKVRQLWPGLDAVPVVADVTDEARIRAVLSAHAPQVVVHAAAHKHVPLMEANVGEAVHNNVFGTELLARLSGELGVGSFIMISTDKAVRPSSIMGATKRVAELAVQVLDQRHPRTCYVAVRFGNVLGSAGSVIPIFREQIAAGGPVTVTHPDMKRYFMTIPEAAQLVLQAGAMGHGGEIFVLDMGEPVRIVDIAREMIRLAGYKPDSEIEVRFTGTRPGEKLFEELATSGEEIEKTRHPKIFIGNIEGMPASAVNSALERLGQLVEAGDAEAIRRYLAELLPEARLEGAASAAVVVGLS